MNHGTIFQPYLKFLEVKQIILSAVRLKCLAKGDNTSCLKCSGSQQGPLDLKLSNLLL